MVAFAALILTACGGAPSRPSSSTLSPDDARGFDTSVVSSDTTISVDVPPGFVTSRQWAVISNDSFRVLIASLEAPRENSGWRDQETPAGSLPGLSLRDLGSSLNARLRLQSLPAPTSTFRDTEHGPVTERWSWGDTLAISFDAATDRLTAVEWSSGQPNWTTLFKDMGEWSLVENGTLGPEWYGPLLGAGRSGRGPLLRALPNGDRLGLLTISYSWPGPPDS